MRKSISLKLAIVIASLALVGGVIGGLMTRKRPMANTDQTKPMAEGGVIYASHCAACHGVNLEGQANWRERLDNGRMPAPPHDESGHTWHHPDSVVFDITKHGLGKYAPLGYVSDMPAFAGTLDDGQIWAVLGFIKSTWPPNVADYQERIDRQSRR